MKTLSILALFFLILSASCTTYREFDKEESFVFDINDSSQIVIGTENWKGREDCSATAYMNRTETGLLLTIRVKDDSVRTGNEFSYMNDGVEIYMDLRPPRLRNRNAYEKGVFQAVIIPLPGKKNVAPIEWYPKNYTSDVTGASAWTQLFDSSYVVQVYFPYSSLKRNHYWPRSYFSMDIAINDADSVNRETQIMWRGKADNWSSPINFQPISVMENKSVSVSARKKKSDKPNILLILTSQQNIAAMSAYGNPYINTPNMDALANAGIMFNKSYCSSPAASPSRISILTSLYPHQTKLNHDGQKPDSSILNMGQLFRKGGYRTIWGGKWQLPDAFPHSSGMDSVAGFEIINFLIPEKTTGLGNDTDSPLADAMAKQIQRHPNEPWLMVVSFQNPHDIVNLVARKNAYLPAVNPQSTAPLPVNFGKDINEPEFLESVRKMGAGNSYNSKASELDWRNYNFQYYRLVEQVDKEIGKLIAMLERQGNDENTIILFTSDYGDGSGAHTWAGGFSPYEEGMKVPLIFSWFGKEFKTSTDNTHLVSGIDVLPTLLDYAELEIPSSLEGRSLKPIIENKEADFRDFLFAQFAPNLAKPDDLGRITWYKNYKYILYSSGENNEQLFDLKNDPGEMENLATSAKHQEIKNYIHSNLNAWMKEKNDYFKQSDFLPQ